MVGSVTFLFWVLHKNVCLLVSVTLQHLRPRTTATRERATALQHLHHLPRARRGLDTSSLGQQRGRDLCCVQPQYRTIAIHTCNYGNTVFTYRPFDLLSHAILPAVSFGLWTRLWAFELWLSSRADFFGPDSFVQMSLPCRGASSSRSWTL